MIASLAPLWSAIVLAALGGGDDFATALRHYQDVVRVLVSEERLKDADVDATKEAIAAVAATGDAASLDQLATDSDALSKRIGALVLERGQKRADRDQLKGGLADQNGKDRERDEKKLHDLDDRLTIIDGQLPRVTRLHDLVFTGLLDAIDRVGAASPDAAFESLVANFKIDVAAIAERDLRVADLEARANTAAAKTNGAADEERRKLERETAELNARIETARADLGERKALQSRRIAALARLFPKLPDGRRKLEVDRIRKDLDDDQEWSVRAFRAELWGALPADSVVADLLTVMHQAARAKATIDKSLDPLREAYDRAAKALVQASKGSTQVPTATAETEARARKELQTASASGFGESRVMEACVRGLTSQLAVVEGAARTAAVDAITKAIAKETDSDVRSRLVSSLAGVADDGALAALRGFAEKGADVRARIAALDALAAGTGDEATVDLIVSRLLADSDWRVRAASIRYLVQVPRKRAVPALIASLGVEVGRLVDDAEHALTELTGQSFHGDAKLWKDWWAANEATFSVKPHASDDAVANAAADARTGQSQEHVSFYGIQTRSQRVLFVVDRSGSMDEPLSAEKDDKKGMKKMAAAKAELKAAIAGFSAGDRFNIITYSTDVTRWQRRMVEHSDKTVRAADAWIDKDVQALGGTNIHDALREAFQLAGIGAVDKAYEAGVDTIFFLTDGKPSVGEVVDPNEILVRVREWNRLSRIVVHTIGVGKDQDEVFLRRLAQENGGQYARK